MPSYRALHQKEVSMKEQGKPKWRITSLERWGMRAAHDFQLESCAFVKEAGYNAVLVNGGSGFGPDMMCPESLVQTQSLPDLMPFTVRAHRQEMRRRCALLRQSGLSPWLCVWGICGPDDSKGSEAAESNRFFDRRTKLEMHALQEASPALFGCRHPHALSWRGSRPLCLSQPDVPAFYRELFRRIREEYPDLSGVLFFPGDNDPECCDDTCGRCRASGNDGWDRMMSHINNVYAALQESRPHIPFFVAIWNRPDTVEGRNIIRRFVQTLAPGIGLAMSLPDVSTQQRKSGPMVFHQPWSLYPEPGNLFLWTLQQSRQNDRPMMVLGEISQSEVWDPVCHNMPTPLKTLAFLRNVNRLEGIEAVLDFWGNRSPFIPHANHAVLQQWLADSAATDQNLLSRAIARHYSVSEQSEAARRALDCWLMWNAATDHWALCAWGQRFSYAIGRDAARGKLYPPLIPPFLRQKNWGLGEILAHPVGPEAFARFQKEDSAQWQRVGAAFRALADSIEAFSPHGARLARRESATIELAAELIVSIGRTVAAAAAWQRKDAATLRNLIEAEIEGRERQLALSGTLGLGAGINPILVSEDLQNMRLFLSARRFPDVPDDRFRWTPSPFSV